MSSNKRTLADTDTGLSDSIPDAKKRKLNDDHDKDHTPVTIQPLTTASPSMNPSAQPLNINSHQTDKTMSLPTTNPSINNININDTDPNTTNNNKNKNDNTAKCNQNNDQKNDSNADIDKWKFTASDFTFGDNSWVRQSSNISNISAADTLSQTSNKESIANNNTTDSFSQFAGLGFQKVLDENKNKTENKTENEKKNDDPWGAAWSNPDGTFKLNFNWGSWENANTKIDLNPSTAVGWESTAVKYDPDDIEENDDTKKLVQCMGGEQDSGDADDDTKHCVDCVVYNLESGKYVERGKGVVKLNTYKMDGELKARILCRRDQILTTIINAPILKDTKFEKVGSFIRFGVVEMVEVDKEDDGKKEDDKKKKENDEDYDLNIKTYLIKPIDKLRIDELFNKIKDIQEQVSK